MTHTERRARFEKDVRDYFQPSSDVLTDYDFRRMGDIFERYSTHTEVIIKKETVYDDVKIVVKVCPKCENATRHLVRSVDISIREIENIVSDYLSIPAIKIRSMSRRVEAVRARKYIFFLSRKYTILSLKEIGEYFGGRDHTTVIHNIQNMNAEIGCSEITIQHLADLEDLIVQYTSKKEATA